MKLLIWGPIGTLKTRIALQFPSPVVIDLERGTARYKDEFKFDVLPPANPDQMLEAIRWLRDARHHYKTLVIDPVSMYWAELQRKWSDIFLARLHGRKTHHHEFFELTPREWGTIKSEFNEMIRACLQLDMNVVFTAHEKTQYESGGGEQMRKIGEMPDCEKNLTRHFDIVLKTEQRLVGPSKVQVIATTQKDRTAKLPAQFELTYKAIADAAGDLDSLDRDAQAFDAPSAETIDQINSQIEFLELPASSVIDALASYGVSQVTDLSRTQAETVLARLEVAVKKKRDAMPPVQVAKEGS